MYIDEGTNKLFFKSKSRSIINPIYHQCGCPAKGSDHAVDADHSFLQRHSADVEGIPKAENILG
jgi:hypothetical protein